MPHRKVTSAPAVSAAAPASAAVALLESLPEAALITRDRWDGAGVEILAANAKFSVLSGYAREALVGQNTRLLHGPKTEIITPRTSGSLTERLLAGEGWLHRRDGVPFFASWNFSPLEPGLMVALFRDLSEHRRLQEAMFHSQKLDTVGQLAGGVAHDFNNLLSIINGYCEIMSAKLADVPEAQKDLEEIHRAGQKAARLARQILEFSRRQETEARVVNPNTLVREIADILRRVVGDAVKVELRLASDLGNTRIDPTQFQQVLLNLCFNARDAMPQGGKLTVRTANHEQKTAADGLRAGSYVMVQVTDTGTGMDDATLARVWEPFFTTKPHGTGLGLALAFAVVKSCDGRIAVRSKPGAGTTFEVLLPETAEPEQVYSTMIPALPSAKGSELLWLVEEDDVLRKMVSGILTVDGYRVAEFARIGDALAAVRKEPAPQLLLLDASATDAAKLARTLHSKSPTLKLLAVSADSPAPALRDFPARAFAHLPKPFALSTLLRSVRGLLDAR
ncbi:MAG: PAS domain S-box protein [Opitutae bacterium]|nr:PAS domain S-box protein [Opitutae bacterium]